MTSLQTPPTQPTQPANEYAPVAWMTAAEAAAHAKAAKAHAKSLRPWFKKKRFIVPLSIMALFTVAQISNGGSNSAPTAAPAVAGEQTGGTVADKAAAPKAAAPKAAQPKAAQPKAAQPKVAQPKVAEPKAAEPAEPANEVANATIGSKVSSGDFTIVITKVRTGVKSVGTEYVGEKAQGRYVLVNLKATNEGDKANYLLGDNVKLLDAKGREFSVDEMASIYVSDNNPLLEEINPGNTSKGTLVFDLPKGVKATQAEISAGGLFDEPTVVDLTS